MWVATLFNNWINAHSQQETSFEPPNNKIPQYIKFLDLTKNSVKKKKISSLHFFFFQINAKYCKPFWGHADKID